MRIAPLDRNTLDAALSRKIDAAEQLMGFAPNDALTMARNPALLDAVAGLVGAVYGAGSVDPGLKRLIGEATSKAAGCFYCAAHAANGARDHGVDAERIAAVWRYEESDFFSPAEKAAIRVAMKAGMSPNETTDEDFSALKEFYSEDEIIEIVGVVAMFGFLNRWNSTLQTALEPAPSASLDEIGIGEGGIG